jgi:ActR/RegA family two-component response regulator
MTLQALLVSKDDQSAEALTRAMAGFGVAVERSSDPEIAASRLAEHSFDTIVVDFDEAGEASSILHVARQNSADGRASQIITIALVGDAYRFEAFWERGALYLD